MSLVSEFFKANVILHAIYYKILKYIKDKLTTRKINNTTIDKSFSLNEMLGCLDIPVASNIYLYVGLRHIKKKTGL